MIWTLYHIWMNIMVSWKVWLWDYFDFVDYWRWHFLYLLFACLFFLCIARIFRNVQVTKIDARLHRALIRLTKKK